MLFFRLLSRIPELFFKSDIMKRDDKKKLIKKHQKHEKDTGSSEVQVAILTSRIKHLTEHLQTHKNDVHSRRGLLKLVGKRRSHLQYLKRKSKDQYEDLVQKLKIRTTTDKKQAE